MTNNLLVSIHIPKTAGTTIGYILDYGVKRRIFYDYMGPHGYRGNVYDQDVDLLNQHKDFISKKFDVIHGHFHYKKYAQIFPEADFIVCLRKPVARTISQYFHIIEEADPRHWLYEDLVSGNMDFIDFVSQPHIKKAQSIFVEGRDIMDFKHVFLTEKLSESIYQFQLLTGFQRSDPYMSLKGEDSIPNTNPRSARRRKELINKLRDIYSRLSGVKKQSTRENFKITSSEIEKAKQILSEESDLYQRAEEKFALQAKLASRVD